MSDDTPSVRHVFRWDLDKTYLHTDFDTWIDLVKTAVEKPEGKRTVTGAAALLRELRATVPSVVTILSGSPEQMRNTLEAKLRLDGIQWDSFTLKPSLQNLVRLRFRALRDQVGYKLPALLEARTKVPADVPETLFGDDAEADALVYSLYADLLGDRVDDKTLTAVMEHAEAYPDAVNQAVRLAQTVPRTDPVRRIFIHLERRSDPAFFRRYGARLVPVFDYFQAALVLCMDGVLSARSTAHVAAMCTLDGATTVAALASSAADIVARGHLRREALAPVAAALRATEPPRPLDEADASALADALDAVPDAPAPAPDAEGPIDYVAALFEDRARWEAAKTAAKSAKKAKRRKA